MKSFVVAIFFFALSVQANSQSAKNIDQYLNKYQASVQGITDAVYYRSIEGISGKFLVTDYYMSNDSVAMQAVCSEVFPNLVQDGECVWYYANGVTKEEGYFKDDKRTGLFKTYYQNGSLNSEIDYRGENGLSNYYQQFWTPEGQTLLINGSGLIDPQYSVSEFDHSYKEFKEHALIGSYTIRQQQGDTLYSVTETSAEYADGGMPGFYEDVGEGLLGKYPKKAIKNGVQGNVFIKFLIDIDGLLKETEILKGIGSGCDEIALEIISKLGKWNPAIHYGRRVKQLMVLPIKFKLN